MYWRLTGVALFVCVLTFVFLPGQSQALNLVFFSDTLSTSAPNAYSNHTFEFEPNASIAPSGSLTFDWPSDFNVSATGSTFDVRNVELLVNGTPRSATTSASASDDGVSITSGAGGSITYTLNSTTGISAGDVLTFKVGNHTTNSLPERVVAVGTSSTTTLPADIQPIQNSNATGTHQIELTTTGAAEPIGGDFVVFLVEQVGVGPVDTTEDIPPFRFNGAPSSTISGTTLNVELSLETDEFASCRFSRTASTSYSVMTDDFDSSGLVIHTALVAVTPDTIETFYVRCQDDEGNTNFDDYLIQFTVPPEPTGEPNPDADPGGDGSGDGTSGTGGGEGDNDGTSNDGDNSGSQSSGSGGGGSGGGGGGGSSTGTGGGFEDDGPYESGDGRVFVTGTAWPGADITVLVDGQIAEDGRANNDGEFSVLIDEIARGPYTFGVYAEDDNGVKSNTFSTSFTVSGARAVTLSNIDITGTLEVTPNPVDPGVTATIRGYTLPNAQVTIENRPQNGSATTLLASSNSDGFYTTSLSTNGFSQGTYEIRFRAEPSVGSPTEFTDWFYYGVGQEADVPINADLNRDGSVNLIDFSILLFWWNTNGGDSDPPADINRDGRVSLTDFSIMLFNWTG
ncbi:hypothetical protein CL655_03505 [bacterium]|nr:hypothetical protein [bacterium]